ncbi:MAG: methyltransferase domain-containing protein [Candidatus Marinimicrobia bacterium]|nr:methyltransferase domain-containing protein [Candidatus Neomarinimicrobiota bacterium]
MKATPKRAARPGSSIPGATEAARPGGVYGPDDLEQLDVDALFAGRMAAGPFRAMGATQWDQRASRLRPGELVADDYTRALLQRLEPDIAASRSLLDVGCGNGNLLLALAPRLAWAGGLGFSPAMLRRLRARAAAARLRGLRTWLRAWDDDWSDLPVADIVVASRSFTTPHLTPALRKLEAHARRRVFLTYKTGPAFLPADLLRALGRHGLPGRPSYLYLLLALHKMGRWPQLEFLADHRRPTPLKNLAELRQRVTWSLGPLATPDRRALKAYYEALPRDQAGRALFHNPFHWALISWAPGP